MGGLENLFVNHCLKRGIRGRATRDLSKR